jgi:phage/conjugal plasmid C-4 type zinc finger TraR family protein
MKGGEFAIELAQHRVAQERDAGLARVAAIVNRQGELECQTCGVDIPLTRRVAAPFAVRCVDCQNKHEKQLKRSA